MAVRVTHIGIQSRDCMRCHFLTIIQMTKKCFACVYVQSQSQWTAARPASHHFVCVCV